jgi:hypothetical protein
MTDARVERIEPDPLLAADFLDQAKSFAADGAPNTLSAASRQVLLHSSVVAACDALLAINGRKIEGSDGSHRLRLTETQPLLGGDHHELFESLDEARVARNDVSYRASLAPLPDAEETALAVQQLLSLIEAQLTPHLPEWRAGH